MIFFIIFIIIPLTEISVFIAVGDEIGILATLLLCLLTAIIGGFLVRQQGLNTLFRGRQALNQGYLPVEEIFDGFCIVISGAMLITPGFVTDIIGFSLLIPAVRRILRTHLSSRMEFYMDTSGQDYSSRPRGDIIEGDYEKVDPDQQEPHDKP